MNRTLDAAVIADLEMMMKQTKSVTSYMIGILRDLKAEQEAVHPLITEQAQALSQALEEAMALNSAAFDVRPGETERQRRSELDDAFRAEKNVLDELLQMPTK